MAKWALHRERIHDTELRQMQLFVQSEVESRNFREHPDSLCTPFGTQYPVSSWDTSSCCSHFAPTHCISRTMYRLKYCFMILPLECKHYQTSGLGCNWDSVWILDSVAERTWELDGAVQEWWRVMAPKSLLALFLIVVCHMPKLHTPCTVVDRQSQPIWYLSS